MVKPTPKSDEVPTEVVAAVPQEAVADDEPQRDPLPDHKDELVAVAIDRGIPSYEAWAMTVPELTEKLES